MAKMSLTFDGFDKLAEKIDRAKGDLRGAVNEALEDTETIVQEQVTGAAGRYAKGGGRGYATGAMMSAVKGTHGVEWEGYVAQVGVGFNLEVPGGFHSIFIMYGTPKYQKDTKLYNSVFGARTRSLIAEKQHEVMVKHLDLAGGR